jgi:hypothetical protein
VNDEQQVPGMNPPAREGFEPQQADAVLEAAAEEDEEAQIRIIAIRFAQPQTTWKTALEILYMSSL